MIFRRLASLNRPAAVKSRKGAATEKTRRKLFLEGLERRDLLAGVTTDKLDYHPAETALISATGYEAGETVRFQVLHTDGTPNTGNGHDAWFVKDGSAADLDGLRDGNVETNWYVDPDDSLGAIFELSALGLSSGLYDTHVFTDAIKVDLDQWANDEVAWQNGNINENNATYAEGDVVPFHYAISGLTAGHSYSIGIEWDTTENSGAHAYDYITDYNETESDPPTNPLLNTSGNLIPNVPVGTDFFSVPIDPRVTNGPDALPGTADDIVQLPGSFKVYGGDMTAVSNYVFAGTYTSGIGYVGATKTGLIITFTAGGAGNNVTTVIAWGGHISTRAQWQPEPTASNISGSPYHMRSSDTLRDNTTADTQNLGQQDRSLSAAAVVTPGTITVIKDVTGGEDPQDFNFSITAAVDPQPTPASFTLDDDSASATPNSQIFSLTTFGNYTISEAVLAGWNSSITVTGPNGTTNVNGNLTTISLTEGANWTLTFNNLKQNPALNIVKDATINGGTADIAGEVISYAIAVQNTGNQTLTGVTVVDPFISNLTRIADLVGDNDNLLEVGETWRFTASHVVTQAEIDAGTNIVNVATADSNETGPDTDDAAIPVTQNPALNILKDATVPGGTANIAGEVISYAISVQNTGNQTLTGVTVVDPFVSNLTRITDQVGDNDALLEVGETWRFTASHVVTQAEIDAGTNIVNVATADSNQTPPDSDDASIPVTQTPALNILKDATVPGGTADIAGEVISYTILVQNTGNQTLTGITVVDPFISNLTRIADLVGDNDALLEVGETWRFTASHIVTQAEIDAGANIVNIATADSNQTPPDSDDATVPVTQNPALNILKDATVPGGTADVAGEVISYAIAVQNTGNQTLTGVTVVDPFVSNLTRITDLVGDNDNLLEVGETWRFTASHTVTQAEVDAGQNIVNIATADSNQTPPDSDDASVPVAQTAALNIVKDATVPGGTADIAGEVITYAISVQNTGNQTLTSVTVVDPFVSNLTRIADQTGDNDNLLEIGETWRFTASHVVTQAEIDAGVNIVNVATADSNETPPDSDDAAVPVTQNPALRILKDASVPGGTADSAGEVISYVIAVQNTGNQTLTGVTVVDPFVSNLTRIADLVGDNDALLEVGETWRYTASHAVTQAEIDAGTNIVNIATADSNQTPPDSDDATVPVSQTPALNIVKDACVPGNTADIAGEVITYAISVQNTGNQTLTGVTVVDPFVSNLIRIADQTGDNDNLLEVGETWRYTASHIVTQAEIDSGANIVNVATADSNETPSDSDDATVPVTQTPSLNIVKDAAVPGNTANIAGEVITYAISVQNTGNQTLTGVTVADPFVSNLIRIADLVGDNDNLLEVGETWRYTASHIVTQAEIDAGANIVNVATADSNQTPPDSDDATVPVAQIPALNILKNATVPGGTADIAGEVINYAISVQNTGNQTLTGVTVVDPFVSNLTRITDLLGDNDSLLEVGETWQFIASHIVTQAEIDAGINIVNVATADSNETPPDSDDATVPVTRRPGLTIVKDASVPGGTADVAGEVITYLIAIQNTGNVTLTGERVDDSFVTNLTRLADRIGDNDNLFEVGEILLFTATHVVTQAEINAGTDIVNVATARSNETPPTSDDASIPVAQAAALTLVKLTNGQDANAAPGPVLQVGSTATFTYIVSNTGNVTFTNVVLIDDDGTPGNPADDFHPTFTGGDVNGNGLLDAGEAWTFTATHVVTAGQYTNLGTVTASTLAGTTASVSDPASHFGRSGIIVVTPDKGNASQPFVHIVDASTGDVLTRFLAYEQSYRGGVRVATGDINGDGIDEIITVPGRSLAPRIKVFDQQGNLLHSFMAFPGSFKGGVDVAVGDVNGDGKNDIVASMTYNGSQVKAFRNDSTGSSLGFTTFTTFNPFGTFKGGATVEVASLGTAFKSGGATKLNNVVDARSEIIVASGSGMRSTVKVFAFTGSSKTPAAVRTFLPLGASFKGGITMDVDRVNADAVPDIIVAAGNGGSSQVRVLSGTNGAILSGFNAYNDGSRNAPVHVAAADETGDGIADYIFTAQGTDGATRKVRKFEALSASLVDDVMESHIDFGGAYFLETLLSQSQISS